MLRFRLIRHILIFTYGWIGIFSNLEMRQYVKDIMSPKIIPTSSFFKNLNVKTCEKFKTHIFYNNIQLFMNYTYNRGKGTLQHMYNRCKLKIFEFQQAKNVVKAKVE